MVHRWYRHLDVPTALRRLDAVGFGGHWALIAVVDGDPAPALVPSVAGALQGVPEVTAAGRQLAVPLGGLVASAPAMVVFTGFDEVWLLARRPGAPAPAGVGITSERAFDGVPHDLARWMAGAGCVAGLGDGIGLNAFGAAGVHDALGAAAEG